LIGFTTPNDIVPLNFVVPYCKPLLCADRSVYTLFECDFAYLSFLFVVKDSEVLWQSCTSPALSQGPKVGMGYAEATPSSGQ
jgi:hypothetical protein